MLGGVDSGRELLRTYLPLYIYVRWLGLGDFPYARGLLCYPLGKNPILLLHSAYVLDCGNT